MVSFTTIDSYLHIQNIKAIVICKIKKNAFRIYVYSAGQRPFFGTASRFEYGCQSVCLLIQGTISKEQRISFWRYRFTGLPYSLFIPICFPSLFSSSSSPPWWQVGHRSRQSCFLPSIWPYHLNAVVPRFLISDEATSTSYHKASFLRLFYFVAWRILK